MKFLIVSLRKSTMVCTPNTRLLTGSSVNYIRQKIKVLKSLIASTVKNMVLIICELNQERMKKELTCNMDLDKTQGEDLLNSWKAS